MHCHRRRELSAEFTIPLEVPLAAHRVAAAAARLAMQQHPDASAREAGALAGVVPRQPLRHVMSSADIGQRTFRGRGAEHIDEAIHVSHRERI